MDSSIREEIERANQLAVERMIESEPILLGLKSAREVIPYFRGMSLTHAGPPISWENASGPLRGAIIGAMLLEGWASSPEEAERICRRGEVRLEPNHSVGAVGPMAGVISPSMQLFVVENRKYGNVAYSNINEGLGKVLRYGVYREEVIKRLRYLNGVFADVLRAALDAARREEGGISLKNIMSRALHMGDELHNRHVAATSLFIRETAPYISDSAGRAEAKNVLKTIAGNDHFFLNIAMAAAKSMADASRNVEMSTLVVAMARNGTEVGIQMSGTGDEWFTYRAPVPRGLFFPGYDERDANPDIGDSTIMETVGLGGAAMASSPAILGFVGGTLEEAIEATLRTRKITVARHRYFTIPYLNFEGTPTGIDVRKVLQTGITPTANTGIAHRMPNKGQIGAGIVQLPLEPFKDAIRAFASRYGI